MDAIGECPNVALRCAVSHDALIAMVSFPARTLAPCVARTLAPALVVLSLARARPPRGQAVAFRSRSATRAPMPSSRTP